ncbi:putative fatty acyl-CoA reductase CG8306 [Ctenocephalides felis]|uniref:putative fatty acyl-CoA reductase CG8306 n=1 Tax=Ctenocephalides felis TaxID=7515 RepID=UPI000E6E4669|nr:putative fatty acyl-CoA reductase CG8306 [Ctenocephalides felis]
MPDSEQSYENSDVANFYAGKNVFITGGTGFVGICLIEKLLRSCPDVSKIYILMRPKKGVEIEKRLEELTKNLIFERLRNKNPNDDSIFKKLRAIAGDVGEPELGISSADRQLLAEEINIVIHSAATLDFQATLKPTVDINLLGTRRMMELASTMKKLVALVHVSSAYVNSFKLETEEILYPAPDDAEKVIGFANTLSEDALDELTPKLLKDHPNTYTFTKHLAEHEVNKVASKFPCAIVRPSMITASWKEPVPGWTISKNGPQGFLMGASKGVVRRLPVGKDLIYDYIPVDIVVNQLLVAAYQAAKLKSSDLLIYHCTSSTYRPFRWATVESKINGYLHKYPLKSAVWYPHLKLLPSIWLFKISALFFHFLPAYVLDFVTRIAGGRPILVKLHTNVNASLNRLERFIFTEWKFDNSKTLALNKSLSEVDKNLFRIDIATLDWGNYFIDLTQGVRRYLSNEGPKTLNAARGKDTMLMIMHLAFQGIMFSLMWYLGSCALGMPMTKCPWLVPAFYILFSFL